MAVTLTSRVEATAYQQLLGGRMNELCHLPLIIIPKRE
jgi:hypothetical protein